MKKIQNDDQAWEIGVLDAAGYLSEDDFDFREIMEGEYQWAYQEGIAHFRIFGNQELIDRLESNWVER